MIRKNNFFLLCFLLTFVSMSFGQNRAEFEAVYKVRFVKDTTDISKVVEEDLSLLIGNNESIFRSLQKDISDSIRNKIVEQALLGSGNGQIILKPTNNQTVFFKPEIYKKNGELVGYSEFLSKIYQYPIVEKLVWDVMDESKLISKYMCQKAITTYKNRRYIAWFTFDIPFPEGPYVFKGLPGLVLEVYDENQYFNFSLTGFNKSEKYIIPPKKTIFTEYQKYERMRRNFLDDPIGFFQSHTKFTIPENDRERIKKMHQSKNNFID